MEAKHTPGPWELDDEAGNRPQRGSGGERVWKVVRPRGGLIADVSAWWVATGTARENARLIAAAPELAEALLCVIACLSQPVQTTEIGDDMRRLRGAVNILRVDAAGARKSAEAALRKAGILED